MSSDVLCKIDSKKIMYIASFFGKMNYKMTDVSLTFKKTKIKVKTNKNLMKAF